jgi:exodeoxyribonuclease III
MKIATFNTNSIRQRLGIINDWVTAERPDILCMQETKVKDEEFPSDALRALNYNIIFKGQKGYNGVAILSKSPFQDVRLSLTGKEEDARFISASVSDLYVINVYVPQGVAPGTEKFQYKLNWLKNLLELLKKDYMPDKPVIVTGDFNVALEPVDVYDPVGLRGEVGFHPDEQAMLKSLMEWGLIDIFRMHHKEGGRYTFWDYRIPNGFKRNMGWRIDYILATKPLADRSTDSRIDTKPRTLEKPSDHTFLVAEFEL